MSSNKSEKTGNVAEVKVELGLKTKARLTHMMQQLESRLLHATEGGTIVVRIKHCQADVRDVYITEEAYGVHC
jgi:hypothetical protein